ncbi:MAG TPA: AgmX/PglI C-terminal domain-containing protein [Kofleriaceae bacterium]
MGSSHGTSLQRGSVALYLLFSIVAATAAGYATYVVLRDRKSSVAEAEPAPPRPLPAPRAQPAAEQAELVEATEPAAVDSAERDALAPDDIVEPARDTVLLGKPGVAGDLDAASVERTVKRYLVRYDRCMRRAHEHHGIARGSLRVTLVIGETGNVDYASGAPTNVDDDLAACVVDVMKKLKFDKPGDGAKVKVVYPIAFVPASGADMPPAPVNATDDPLGTIR